MKSRNSLAISINTKCPLARRIVGFLFVLFPTKELCGDSKLQNYSCPCAHLNPLIIGTRLGQTDFQQSFKIQSLAQLSLPPSPTHLLNTQSDQSIISWAFWNVNIGTELFLFPLHLLPYIAFKNLCKLQNKPKFYFNSSYQMTLVDSVS